MLAYFDYYVSSSVSGYRKPNGRGLQINGEEWENSDIDSYLEGVHSWVEDMEGYFYNMNREIPQNIDWNFIATLFYVGKIYE